MGEMTDNSRAIKANSSQWLERTSFVTAAVFLWTTLALTVPTESMAQPRPGDNRMRIYRLDMVHGPDVSDMMALRIEEFYKAILDVNSQFHLLMDEDLIIGLAPEVKEKPSNPALEKADEALWQGKEKVDRGRYRKAASLLKSAIKGYESNFTDLVDYDKMVDAYLQLAIAQFEQGYKDNARETMDILIVLRPDTRVDPRKFGSEFIEMLEGSRQRLQAKTTAQVYVTSEPMGADVLIDGIPVGKSPSTLSGVLPGKHYLQVRSDGMKTFGKMINLKSSSGLTTVSANLEFDGDQEMAEVDGEYVPPDPLIPYKDTGDFGTNFKRAARYFCSKAYVNYLLYSYVARGAEGYELHLFLYDAEKGEIAELGPITMQKDLSDLQVKLLEVEEVLMRGVSAFPMNRIVQDPPPTVYRVDRQKAMAGVTPESAKERAAVGGIAVTPGGNSRPYGSGAAAPAGNTYGQNPSSSAGAYGNTGTSSGYGSQPAASAPAANPYAARQDSFTQPAQQNPGAYNSFDSSNSSAAGGLGVYDALGQENENEWYEEWWVWTLVGVGVAGVGAGTYLLIDSSNSSDGNGSSFTGTVQLP